MPPSEYPPWELHKSEKKKKLARIQRHIVREQVPAFPWRRLVTEPGNL